ncbi:hypothetical protein AMTRI_Chr08g202350 [Amborella trichopoda]
MEDFTNNARNQEDLQGDNQLERRKWRGSVGGVVSSPIDKVWGLVSHTSRLSQWMPMVENCTTLQGKEDEPGHVRLVFGEIFPTEDGEKSWVKERMISLDKASFSYVYRMEASNFGLDGSMNSIKLVDYGEDSTLVEWSFEVDPIEGTREEIITDYLGFLYKSCIHRIERVLWYCVI